MKDRGTERQRDTHGKTERQKDRDKETHIEKKTFLIYELQV